MDILTHRLAAASDMEVLTALMNAAIRDLLPQFLSPEQVEASFAVMGLDTMLIEDGTYFVIEIGGELAGCGGWSRRATLFGGNHTKGRDARLLDPKTEPARVRAMYTSPALHPPRRGPQSTGAVRRGGAAGRLFPRRIGRHHGRQAFVRSLRLSADRGDTGDHAQWRGSAAAENGQGDLNGFSCRFSRR